MTDLKAIASPWGPPVRLQLRRVKGFDLQALSVATNGRAAVNCARPGPFGNPYIVDGVDHLSPVEACALFARDLKDGFIECPRGRVPIEAVRDRLRGKNLACFCPVLAPWCHVDTLLVVSNEL